MEMQDFLVEDKWIDKNGEEQTALRKVGVSFKMKSGGWRHKLYRNISVSVEAMSLPRKEKRAGGAAEDRGVEDTGDDFLE